MLGSDHAGERAAAGLPADRLVRELGLSWADLLAAGPPPVPVADPREAARACLASGVRWTAWKAAFLRTLARRWGATARQERVLLRLCRRAGVAFVPFD